MSSEAELDSVIGQFGRYQFFLFLAGSICEIPIGMHSIFTVFGAATPDYRCKTCLDDLNEEYYNSLNQTEFEQNIENTFFNARNDSCGGTFIDRCYVKLQKISETDKIFEKYQNFHLSVIF